MVGVPDSVRWKVKQFGVSELNKEHEGGIV